MNFGRGRFAPRIGGTLQRTLREAVPYLKKKKSGGRRRRREQLRLIASSPLFDAQWYLATYTDVAAAGVDPAAHFLDTGWLEGRDPGPDFATSAYLKANADVARENLNPLVHFIEFGQSEGREVRGHPFSPWKRTGIVHQFDAAAPVFRGCSVDEAAAPWCTWHRLSPEDERLYSAGEWRVGYAESPESLSLLEQAFAALRHLSGFGSEEGSRFNIQPGFAELIDAWYVTDRMLRTRWSDRSFPFVVRGFQHDQTANGKLQLVCDAIVASALDPVDLSLADPFSPVQLVFANPDGTVRSLCLLAFPSLCRGGLHYAELLAGCPAGEKPDPIRMGLEQAQRLTDAKSGNANARRTITIDLEGADGKSPLFQPELKRWIERIGGIEVQLEGEVGQFFTQDARSSRSDARGALVLASDMIPTIQALASISSDPDSKGLHPAPLLIAEADPSQPATLVDLPADSPASVRVGAYGYPVPWPLSSNPVGEATALTAAAIRLHPSRGLADAELLVPADNGALPNLAKEPASVTWFLQADDWNHSEITEASRSLRLQSGALTHWIGFIGTPASEIFNAAATRLNGRVRAYSDMAKAMRSTETDLVGHLGPGVILHDARTTAALIGLLDDPQIASASCPVLAADKRGKNWHIAIADVGEIARTSAIHAAAPLSIQQLWRSSFPVKGPPRDLWLARRATATDWFGTKQPKELQQGSHVCTSLVTATYSVHRRRRTHAPAVPAAADDRVTAARILFG